MQHQFHLQSRSNLDRQVSVPFSKKKKKKKKKKEEKGREADPFLRNPFTIVLSILPSHKYLALIYRATKRRSQKRHAKDSWVEPIYERFLRRRWSKVMDRGGDVINVNSKLFPRNKNTTAARIAFVLHDCGKIT